MSFRFFISLIATILIVLYPFVVFFGFHFLPLNWLCLILLCLFSSRLILSYHKKNMLLPKPILLFVSVAALGFSVLGLILQSTLFIKLYPVVMNLAFLFVFISSLTQDDSIIYQIAKKTSRTALPNFARKYTYKVTFVWCVFFALNAMVSSYTALFSSMKVWTFYNGFLAYVGIALLFSVEFIVRTVIKRKHQGA